MHMSPAIWIITQIQSLWREIPVMRIRVRMRCSDLAAQIPVTAARIPIMKIP